MYASLINALFALPLLFTANVCSSPVVGTPTLVARASSDPVSAICSAAANRNTQAWTSNNIGQWFKNEIKPYDVMNWTYSIGGPKVVNIQEWILKLANDGENPCGFLSTDCNPNPEFSQCVLYPEANFVWYAMAAFSNYLGNMANAVFNCQQILSDYTGTMVGQFYTPQTPPSTLIAPISIAVGISAAISSFWPPAAVAAGAGSIANGILTQKGLSAPSPLAQWSDVTGTLGNLTNLTVSAIGTYWTAQLGTTPEVKDSNGDTYDADPTALPAILNGGHFASSESENVQTFPNALFGALASGAINALWNEDKDFIIKMSDDTLGAGAGGACKALPSMTYCDENGVAWIFMRWNWKQVLTGHLTQSMLNTQDWQVWGAYSSPANNPSGNTNQLDKYGLSLEVVAKSSWRVQQKYGFWTDQTPEATAQSVIANIANLSLDQIVSWNMAVCDLDGVLNGKHFVQSGTPWYQYVGCSCATMKGWPLPLPSDSQLSVSACPGAWKS